MKIQKLAGAVAAVAITFGMGGVAAPTASATDNIRAFGEQEKILGWNGLPIIGYTVDKLVESKDPVPHKGKLFMANLKVDGFGTDTPAQIERFGARALKGQFYPAIQGASTMQKLYFDVVGPVPNSVVWNDGFRDILAWVPGPKQGGNRP